MRQHMRPIAAVAAILIAAHPAYAIGPEAEAAFISGRFADAAGYAEGLDTADAQAFAARAILAECMTGETEPEPGRVIEAEQLSRAALDKDPEHVEAKLQLAISLSLRARPMSTSEARKSGFGDMTKDLAESVLEEDPANPYANAIISIWNIEVLRRGGRLGGIVMGASLKKARQHYEVAAAATPDDAALHWQYARALAAQNAKKNHDEIMDVLHRSMAANVDDEIERVMQWRASYLASQIGELKPKNIEQLAEQML